MYLTNDYLVNSFNVGRAMKKLKPTGIVKDFFQTEEEGWHPYLLYVKPSIP